MKWRSTTTSRRRRWTALSSSSTYTMTKTNRKSQSIWKKSTKTGAVRILRTRLMASSGKTGSHLDESLAAAARVWREAEGDLEGARLRTCWRHRSANDGLSVSSICQKLLRIRTWRGKKSTWAPYTKTPSLTWSRKSQNVGSVLAKHQWTHEYSLERCLEN